MSVSLPTVCLLSAGLLHISRLGDLRALSLMNCMRLTEGGMLAAAGGLTRLTELSLRGCPAVTNAVAALLERLPAVQTVDLRACEHVTGASAEVGSYQHSSRLMLQKWLNCKACELLNGFDYAHCIQHRTRLRANRHGLGPLGCIPGNWWRLQRCRCK